MTTLYLRFKTTVAEPQVCPLLDRLLSRADACVQVTDWRTDAFLSQARNGEELTRVSAEVLAAAPIALAAAHGPVSGAWACFATPVHYTAEMSNVRLPRDGILRLDEQSATALALDFNRVWRDSGICMTLGRFADLLCVFNAPLEVTTRDPESVLDRHIENFLPQGADAPQLRRLMSELEMWLFEHPAICATVPGRSPAANGLWLWGGGASRAALPGIDLNSGGDDAVFSYFGGDVSRGGVVVAPLPGGAGGLAVESQWLQPALSGLKSGRLARLLLSAADRCFTVRATSLRRFWRRQRPWIEHFQ